MFRSPRRRDTRQKSGFSVSGDKSGNEAVLIRAHRFRVNSSRLVLYFEVTDLPLPAQFGKSFGMGALGGYVKSASPCQALLELKVIDILDKTEIVGANKEFAVESERWTKFGIDAEVEDANAYDVVMLKAKVEFNTINEVTIGEIQFLGINVDTVTAYSDRSIREDYQKKTQLYYPEIYYLKHDAAFVVEPSKIEGDIFEKRPGEQVVLKACNRCARFLPVDIFNEGHAIGFSNHCVQRAPCSHRAFSRLVIENWDTLSGIDEPLRSHIEEEEGIGVVHARLGFQLECRPCKKFEVNAPLNPLRNEAQRREDSLRRRAIEQLAGYLLDQNWIFYTHREKHQEEFDFHIWDRFDRKCFACGKDLPTVGDMALDHTMPLAYLWPLDETATCLCQTCNAQKHDLFPFEFSPYQTPGKLEELAEITGIKPRIISKPVKRANPEAVSRLREEIVWFFEDFLAQEEYQKVRHGKRTADLILASLQRILNETNTGLDLVKGYRKKTGQYPDSITLE